MDEVLEVCLCSLRVYSESLRSICHDKDLTITRLLKKDLIKEALDVDFLHSNMTKSGYMWNEIQEKNLVKTSTMGEPYVML